MGTAYNAFARFVALVGVIVVIVWAINDPLPWAAIIGLLLAVALFAAYQSTRHDEEDR